MLDPHLIEAFARLDRHLYDICGTEEARAGLLAGGGATGWDAVRELTKPSITTLAFSNIVPDSLVPRGNHPLHRLREAIGLADVEVEALLVLLAPHIEPRYRSLYAVLQDNLSQAWVTERLLLTVLGTSPDRRRTLLHSLISGTLASDGWITFPRSEPPAPLGRAVDLAPEVRAGVLGLPLPARTGALHLAYTPASPGPVHTITPERLVVVHGSGDRREEVASRVDASGHAALWATGTATEDDVGAAWRLSSLLGSTLVLDLSDLARDALQPIARMLQRRTSKGGRAILIGRDPLPLAIPHRAVDSAGFAQRVQAWKEASAAFGDELDEAACRRLAAGCRWGPHGIHRVVASAEHRSESGLAAEAARLNDRRVRHGTQLLADRGFGDLVLRDTTIAALRRLVFFVRNRDRVAEERNLEQRFRLKKGPIVLFSGRPGTGKTLAAEVIAAELGRPLYLVDLSQLVSKYIGETEKHIDQVLSDGEQANAVLFFDEADALFSSRTEVSNSNDRFANLEVGYLLQRIERHDGLVILATNLRSSIDEAFLRRFQARVEFPFPELEDREKIWRLMLPDTVPRAGELDIAALSHHRLSGGEIRNSALKAIFMAERAREPLTQAHLEQGIAIELLELGRLSRRGTSGSDTARRDRGALLRSFAEALQDSLETRLREAFLKEIHIVHGAPTKEAMAGLRPGLNLAVYRMSAPPDGPNLRCGFIVSAFSNRAEEEHELLGVVLDGLSARPIRTMDGVRVRMHVQESYDFDLLHRFWSSHAQPMRPSLVVDVEIG